MIRAVAGSIVFTAPMKTRMLGVAAFAWCLAVPAYGQSSDHVAMNSPSCPAQGKKADGSAIKKTSDAGLRNQAKRHLPAGSSPLLVDVADFKTLQQDTDTLTHIDSTKHKATFEPTRTLLQHLAVSKGTVSEGDFVSVSGFLHRAMDGSSEETVNCAGKDGLDTHMNVNAVQPVGTTFDEWSGIVVEAIPQAALPGFTKAQHDAVVAALAAVRDAKLPVLAIGALTYDNEHLVNGDKAHPNKGNPMRMSLWEIHPVTQLFVCPAGETCDPSTPASKWESLKDWRTKNPH